MNVKLNDSQSCANSNLRDFRKLSLEERKKIASAGGKASGKVRKVRRKLRDELEMLLKIGNNQEILVLSLLNKALAGDVKAFEVIRDTVGEKPKDKADVNIYGYEELLKKIKEVE